MTDFRNHSSPPAVPAPASPSEGGVTVGTQTDLPPPPSNFSGQAGLTLFEIAFGPEFVLEDDELTVVDQATPPPRTPSPPR